MADGNEEQAQRVARLIADAFRNQQEPFELPERSKWHASAPAWIAVVVSLATALWSLAVTTNNVEQNTRRIVALEEHDRVQTSSDNRLLERVTRIETKLDIALEKKS